MTNAKDLPTLLAAASWTQQHLVVGGVPMWLTDTGGTWALTAEPSGVQIAQTWYDRIRNSTVNNGGAGPYLLWNGYTWEIIRRVAIGKPWAIGVVVPT